MNKNLLLGILNFYQSRGEIFFEKIYEEMKLFLSQNFLSKIKNFFTRSHFRCDLLKNNYEDLPKNEILQRNSFRFFIIYFLSKVFKRSFKEFLWISFEEWDLMKIFTKDLRIIFILLKIFKRKFWRRASYLHNFFLEDFVFGYDQLN